MRFRRNKSDDTGADAGVPAGVADPVANATPPGPVYPDDYPPGAPAPTQVDLTAPAQTGAEFDMNTVGIAAEQPAAQQRSRKGDPPPVSAQINSVGVAILPGVPLPAWVAPVPAPVAQHPVDPLYQQQTVSPPPPDPQPASPAPSAAAPTLTPAPAPAPAPNAEPSPAPPMPMPMPMPVPVPAAQAVAAPAVPATAAAVPTPSLPLPPPDPAQWSEHPIGPVVWGPVAPPQPMTMPQPAPASPTPEPAFAAAAPAAVATAFAASPPPVGPPPVGAPMAPPSTQPVFETPSAAPAPAPPVSAPQQDQPWPTGTAAKVAPGTAWFQDTPAAAAPTGPAAQAQGNAQYSWLLEPDTSQAPALVTPPPPAPAPDAPVPDAPVPVTAAPVDLPVAAAVPAAFLAAAPPAGPAFDYSPPAGLAPTAATSPTEQPVAAPVVTTDAAPSTDVTSPPATDAAQDEKRSGAMKWILIVGGIVVALALVAFAAFVTPGFLSSSSSVDTPPTVATPTTAAGLAKSDKAQAAPTAVFKKMAAATGASGSKYATYANEGTSATVWVAPVFGGSPQSLAQAYASAGGQPLDAAATVPAGARGGQMQCASAGAKQTLCFWTADGVRGAADITGVSRSAAGSLAAKMRVALEQPPSQ